MKKLLTTVLLLVIIGFIFSNYNEIMYFVMRNVVYKETNLIQENNIYYKKDEFMYVEETNDFTPKNKQEILNIFYTALNGGWDQFTYYCDTTYTNCISDTQDIINDKYILSNINNFVGTYNSYKKILVNMNSLGRVNIIFEKNYSENLIQILSAKVDEIYNNIINDNMSNRDKIKAVHDYIINNTVYDEEKALEIEKGIVNNYNLSNNAYGPLITGKAICSGYTDAMALFLDKIGITNYKISSERHTWNLVKLDDKWYHLDLTWDDPKVVNENINLLEYNFFLIDSKELEKINTGEHNYDRTVYLEAN